MIKININKYKVWLYLLFFSFAYEKPILILSSMDRLNPRLFDLILILGLLITYNHKSVYRDEIYRKWSYLIFWFMICVFAGFALFNIALSTKFYMLFFLLEYIKGIIILFIFFRIPPGRVTLEDVFYPMIAGGLFVAIYSVYELNVGIESVSLTDSVTVYKPPWFVWGPFVGAYFHIAVFMPLITTILFSKFISDRGYRLIWFILFVFCSWPIFFCGSRTAIFLWLASILCVTYFNKKNRLIFFSGLVFCVPLIYYIFTSDIFSELESISRLQSFESDGGTNSENSIRNRVFNAQNFSLEKYDEHLLLPFIGAGFYVAPVEGHARIGFGVHNIFAFAFEQSGLVGLALFLVFILAFLKKTKRFLKYQTKDPYYWFILAIFSYFVASIVLGFAGHTFWRGFATSNFNTLRVLTLVVASCYISKTFFVHKKPFA